MSLRRDGFLRHFKWHILIICIPIAAVVLLAIFTDVFQIPQAGVVAQFMRLILTVVLLVAVITLLSMAFRIHRLITENGTTLDKISGTLERNRAILTNINQSSRLSETARAIAFRDVDRQSLREAVFDKLQQQDFKSTYEMIDEIAQTAAYEKLAVQLRTEAEQYQSATTQERINQVIAHTEKLFEDHQWAKASTLIERLIRAEPDSEKAKAMRQKLVDKKGERKKVLLNAWDDAVKRQATDRSLEILRELDMYLTPNEGLALQEAAKDVFRTKLHNLGVQFSLDISEKQWQKAFQTGNQIIRNFPNSKMAEEIRERIDILKQKTLK